MGLAQLNYALEYNGSTTYVECENSPSLNMQQSITVEAWIYPFNWNGNRRVLQKGNNDDQYLLAGINYNGEGQLHFSIEVEGGCLTPMLPSSNIWHHVVGVYNQSSSSMYMYIDGFEVEEISGINGNINITSDPLFIGTKYDFAPPQDFFNGVIDEVRIWNIARSQSDIQEFMNRQLTGTEAGLVGYWQFNEGTGNSTFDKTVNANHGTLLGGVQWTNTAAPVLPGWFQMNLDSGTCLPHTSMDIELLFDATEVDSGDFYASIIINSSDPFTPSVVVPIHMIVSSTVGVGDELNTPSTFNLYQNYPNPFNPSTTIKYSIPELSKVKLALFNLLGEEVTTLVNEEKNVGNYSVEFNAVALPSGVYFCQLRAGSFIQTKKMLLLK